jgi:DNA-binding transcriptional LysR family regulator
VALGHLKRGATEKLGGATEAAGTMELHQIRYFLAVCDEQSFTRAAQRCGVSQLSLTNAIKRLEQDLGGMLFHRGRTKTRLSELGQHLRPHLEKLNQCVQEIRDRQCAFTAWLSLDRDRAERRHLSGGIAVQCDRVGSPRK